MRAALAVVLGPAGPASAYYLDAGHRFDVRLRAYAQLGMLTEDSETPSRSGSRKAGLGTFRGHDMLQLRVTGQFN